MLTNIIGNCSLPNKSHYVHANNMKHIVTHSNCSTGRSRNFKILLFFGNERNQNKIIDIKLLVSGHSCQPNDSDFYLKMAKTTYYNHKAGITWYSSVKRTSTVSLKWIVRPSFNRSSITDGCKQKDDWGSRSSQLVKTEVDEVTNCLLYTSRCV